jgi:sulfotransferase family protein
MTDRTPILIAMWSGPRNISTAMMRSFENRDDCAVWDEPFYAAYLNTTGLNHPMREEIIAAGIADWDQTRAHVLGPAPGDAAIFYQKHMSHHMLPGIDRDWIVPARNCFLIRKPENVLASYAAKREDVTLRDIGFAEQAEIFEMVADRLGAPPPVIDANDVLSTPDTMIPKLCDALDIPFDETMMSWPVGQRGSDGIWAAHWYGSVEKSTGFTPPRADTKRSELPAHLGRIAEQATPAYEALSKYRIK